jgi:hypothetical protein
VTGPVASRRRIRHPWGLGIGIVLVLPQLVACVVVIRAQLVVALFGFLMTIGFIRLGSLAYTVLRERVPPIGRGRLAVAGLVALVLGSVLWGQVRVAQLAAADTGFAGTVAPPATVWLNLVTVLTLGLWLTGAAVLIWALGGLLVGRRRAG